MGYIPRQDAQFLAWANAFVNRLQNNQGVYMVSQQDCDALSSALALFSAAFALVSDSGTRTPGAVAQKDLARNNAEGLCRHFAIEIKNNNGISYEAKVDLGINPPNNTRTPIDPPDTSPILEVIASTPGLQTIRYADSMTPAKRGKPFGATSIQLFIGIADANVIITDPADAVFYGAFTKNPVAVAYSAADNGKQATVYGRWVNAKGETGPWSNPATFIIGS